MEYFRLILFLIALLIIAGIVIAYQISSRKRQRAQRYDTQAEPQQHDPMTAEDERAIEDIWHGDKFSARDEKIDVSALQPLMAKKDTAPLEPESGLKTTDELQPEAELLELAEVDVDDNDNDQQDHTYSKAQQEPERVIVLSLLSPDEREVDGELFHLALNRAGYSLGDMDIYHYDDDAGNHLFSIANLYEPGSFEILKEANQRSAFHTDGLVAFIQLPQSLPSLQLLNTMLEQLQMIAEELQFVLCNDQREPMDEDAIEMLREGLSLHDLFDGHKPTE